MTDMRIDLHEELDRMTDRQVTGVKEFLSTFPSPLGATCRNAPEAEEPPTEVEVRLIAEAYEWRMRNGGRGIPDEEIEREFGPLSLE